jgi:FkbM family methyltransferase
MLKKRLKNFAKSNFILFLIANYIKNINNILRGHLALVSANDVLEIFGQKCKEVQFVQVGSNDGKKNDPLNKFIISYNWHGILIEPIQENFKKLTETYNNYSGNLILENIAIATKKSILDFYYIENIKDDEPDWYDQVGSFDKETFFKNISVHKELLKRVGIRKVQAENINEILKKNGFNNIDLLHIDAEGYDFRIISSLNFQKYLPALILYEEEWLSHSDQLECRKLLKTKGYYSLKSGSDIICINKKYLLKR